VIAALAMPMPAENRWGWPRRLILPLLFAAVIAILGYVGISMMLVTTTAHLGGR